PGRARPPWSSTTSCRPGSPAASKSAVARRRYPNRSPGYGSTRSALSPGASRVTADATLAASHDAARGAGSIGPDVPSSWRAAGLWAAGAAGVTRGLAGASGRRAVPELDHVPLRHDVVLAFDPDQPARTGLCHRTRGVQVVERDHFGLDEPPLEVGVYGTCRLERGGALADLPRPGLVAVRCQERLQTQRLEPDPGQHVQAGFFLAHRLE